MPTKTISVTQNDIKLGIPTDPRSCPIALAMIRKNCINPFVAIRTISWGGKIRTHYMNSPAKVADFVDRFDTDKPVHPFTFQLRWKP